MRILICNWKDLAHPRAGGAEVYTQNIAAEWRTLGHDVTIFCSEVAGRASHEMIDGIEYIRRGSRYSVYRAARAYYKNLPRGSYDLVIDEVNTVPFRVARYVKDATVVGLIHQVCREIWPYEVAWPIALLGRYVLEPYWLREFRHIPTVTVSESSRESLEAYGLERVTVVPEGDSRIPELPSVKKEALPTVIFVGRLSANKRPDHAVEAYRLLKRTMPDAQLWVVGTGPMLEVLKRNAPDGVTFFGQVEERLKYTLMARAHVLIATSVREGWGLCVSEAASVGTPAVAYDVAGLRDSVIASGGTLVAENLEALVAGLARGMSKLSEARMIYSAGTVPWRQVADDILEVAGIK